MATNNQNVSSYAAKPDVKGRTTELAFFGKDGQPVRSKFGGYRLHTEYDDRGHDILDEFEDVSGNPMLGNNGYAFLKKSVDALGHIVKARYFDIGMHCCPV